MALDETLARVGDLFAKLKTHAPFTGERILQDFQPDPPTFDVTADYAVLDAGAEVRAVKPLSSVPPIVFGAFIDGVQRTTVLTRVPVGGYPIPIHIAQIGSAVVQRDAVDKQLSVQPEFMHTRLLILGPFSAMEAAGWDDAALFTENAKALGFVRDSDTDAVYQLPSKATQVMVCDTTNTGIGSDQEYRSGTTFSTGDLADIAQLSTRALGRVKWLRVVLEMLTLFAYRVANGSDEWVLVDGPLIFLRTQSERMRKVLGESAYNPAKSLKNVVGLVKEVRLRLQGSEMRVVYDLDEDECTSLVGLAQCVDIKGADAAGSMDYDKTHLTTFTRLRRPRLGLRVPTGEGLVGVDTYLSTYGFDRSDDVTPDSMLNEGRMELAHAIVRGVWRERWPGIKDRKRALTQIYPIEQTERLMQSRLFSLREMAYLASRLKLV